jgi:hypothetical protein
VVDGDVSPGDVELVGLVFGTPSRRLDDGQARDEVSAQRRIPPGRAWSRRHVGDSTVDFGDYVVTRPVCAPAAACCRGLLVTGDV